MIFWLRKLAGVILYLIATVIIPSTYIISMKYYPSGFLGFSLKNLCFEYVIITTSVLCQVWMLFNQFGVERRYPNLFPMVCVIFLVVICALKMYHMEKGIFMILPPPLI